MLESILIPIAMFAMIFGIVYIVTTARNRERLALIEKGADPKLFETNKKYGKYKALRFGMLAVGVAIGLFILSLYTAINEETAYFSMVFLFGGGGLIASHFIISKMKEKNKDDE